MGWKTCDKEFGCPVCRHDDWCGFYVNTKTGEIEVYRCMRTSPLICPDGFFIVKENDDGGVCYKPLSMNGRAWACEKREKKEEIPPEFPDPIWMHKAKIFHKEIMDSGALMHLAGALKVKREGLVQIRAGYDREYNVWTFPHRNGYMRICGIATRTKKGEKKFIPGGNTGLIIPFDIHRMPDPVFIVEGPTDTAALIGHGITAVGRPNDRGGSMSLSLLLKDRKVVVMGENDRKRTKTQWPGYLGARHVATKLAKLWKKDIPFVMPYLSVKDMREWCYMTAFSVNWLHNHVNKHAEIAKPDGTVTVPA